MGILQFIRHENPTKLESECGTKLDEWRFGVRRKEEWFWNALKLIHSWQAPAGGIERR